MKLFKVNSLSGMGWKSTKGCFRRVAVSSGSGGVEWSDATVEVRIRDPDMVTCGSGMPFESEVK